MRRIDLGATDGCGFSPFGIDAKPKRGSPTFAMEVAMKKIKARVEGARMASEKLEYLIVGQRKRNSEASWEWVLFHGPS